MLEQVRALSIYTITPGFRDPHEGSKMARVGVLEEKSRGSCEQAPASPWVYRGFSPASHISRVEASCNTFGSCPFSTDHDIVSVVQKS